MPRVKGVFLVAATTSPCWPVGNHDFRVAQAFGAACGVLGEDIIALGRARQHYARPLDGQGAIGGQAVAAHTGAVGMMLCRRGSRRCRRCCRRAGRPCRPTSPRSPPGPPCARRSAPSGGMESVAWLKSRPARKPKYQLLVNFSSSLHSGGGAPWPRAVVAMPLSSRSKSQPAATRAHRLRYPRRRLADGPAGKPRKEAVRALNKVEGGNAAGIVERVRRRTGKRALSSTPRRPEGTEPAGQLLLKKPRPAGFSKASHCQPVLYQARTE